ncbi:formate/nitrite transporter family protein [Henriciella litoralis]|uniref:formate/nitrite transporter family protein n=1 Tax=Henriciella litoralis TaxID=568102 RepID=UPI0009FE7FF3|nr:formate/nitrite transporter family protein [Henriciella litoralis]
MRDDSPNSPKNDEEQNHITEEERAEASQLTRLKSRIVYEIIRQEGRSELSRPQASIWWSGIAAGIGISMSLVMEAILRVNLPDTPWRHLVESIGYSAGFLLVILARLQLFTENTVTAVIPMLGDPCRNTFGGTARLWSTVFLANMVGGFIAAAFLSYSGAMNADVAGAMLDISRHVAGWGTWETLIKAMPAGFLIAAIVWMLPSSEGSEFWVVLFFTYLIAAGDFAHVVVGSVELFTVALAGEQAPLKLLTMNLLPALAGNIIGGAGLFAMLAWGQVHEEVEGER